MTSAIGRFAVPSAYATIANNALATIASAVAMFNLRQLVTLWLDT